MNAQTHDLDRHIDEAAALARRAHQESEVAIAATQISMLHLLAGIDPDALDQVTHGRVTCEREHREVLRDLVLQPRAFPPGPFPWRFAGNVADAIARGWMLVRRPAAGERPAPWQHAIAAFALQARADALRAGWRFGVPAQRDIDALRQVSYWHLHRIALESPALAITFVPPTPEAQEVAEKIFATERCFSQLAESKLRTRSLLQRVMGR